MLNSLIQANIGINGLLCWNVPALSAFTIKMNHLLFFLLLY